MLSHAAEPPELDQMVAETRARIVAAGERPHVSVAEQLDLLDQLTQFPFGRSLLCNRGWNGYWTHYAVVYHPSRGRESGVDEAGRPYTDLERSLLDLPLVRATQERFNLFQAELQARVRDGVRLGSLPCGLMDDLLGLDLGAVRDFTLLGLDLDADSLRQAALNAEQRGLAEHCELRREDAWDRGDDELDVLTSNGLNIYEPDEARVVALYRAFRHRLAHGGVLITSFLVPPDQHVFEASQADELRLQRIIFQDIVQARFSCYRTVAQTAAQLEAAGFAVEALRFDRALAFPTVVARRVKSR